MQLAVLDYCLPDAYGTSTEKKMIPAGARLFVVCVCETTPHRHTDSTVQDDVKVRSGNALSLRLEG